MGELAGNCLSRHRAGHRIFSRTLPDVLGVLGPVPWKALASSFPGAVPLGNVRFRVRGGAEEPPAHSRVSPWGPESSPRTGRLGIPCHISHCHTHCQIQR